jgi:heat shock protein HslJ
MAIATWIAFVFAAALVACAPGSGNDARSAARNETAPPTSHAEVPAEPAYLIRGEPRPNGAVAWPAVLRGDRLLLKSPTSAGWYAVTLPEPRVAEGRRIYSAERLTLTFEPGACTLREVYPGLPDRILLEWDGGRFEGCGGPRPAPTGIAGTVWELVRIGSDATPDTRSPAATLAFGREGSLGGTLNCNDGGIRSSWTRDGGFVARGEGFEQTAIGCFDAGEAFGRRFWNAMTTARAWRREGERLFVTFADGTEAELRYLL